MVMGLSAVAVYNVSNDPGRVMQRMENGEPGG